MRSKIGIITYHRAINYGAILQAYALQTKLKEFGVQSKILDYRNERLEKIHAKNKIPNSKTLKNFILNLILHKNHSRKYSKFRDFSQKYLELTIPMYSIEDLTAHEDAYDIFITGSDQVWNYKINDMDTAYFLGFVKDKSKKRSYAASFGLSEIPEGYKPIYKNLLNDFDNILIREKQGAKLIKDLLLKESSVVLDPTMLLSKEKWIKLIKNISYNEKYILVYAFEGSANIKNLALNIARKTGYKILWLSNTYKFSYRIKYIKSAGPEEFISLFNNAEYIITNSFHGTAFSINLNKQFITELLPASTGVNSRLEDILYLFDLNDRIIKSSDANIINSIIDYNKVNLILEEERKKSISLLKDAIFSNRKFHI